MPEKGTIRAKLPAKLAILREPSRYKVLYGGRGGAKSWGCAIDLLIRGMEKPLRILCVREIQASISDSVHKLLADRVRDFNLEHFYEVQRSAIRGANGTEFIFLGIQRNPGKVKSTEGIDICWVEEADNISDESLDLLIPTIRKEESEIWFTFNPQFDDDPVYRRFVLNPPDDALLCKMGWEDNPWFSDTLRAEMLYDQKTSPSKHRHIWLGECKDARDGEVYKIDQFARYTKVPKNIHTIVHSWDTAYKPEQHNDPSCCTVWHCSDNAAHLVDNYTKQMSYPELREVAFKMADRDNPNVILIEDKASGQSLIQEFKKYTRHNVLAIKPLHDKETRARTSAYAVEAEKIFLPREANWLAAYERELALFPSDKHHDDQVDSTSQFINWWQKTESPKAFDEMLKDLGYM